MATPTARARREPELARGALGEPADALAHRPHLGADAGVPVVDELAEPDLRRRNSSSQRSSCPRYVHLHTVVQSERVSTPVARYVRKSGRSRKRAARANDAGSFSLSQSSFGSLHLRRDHAADVAQHVVPCALMRSACSMARWSIQTMTFCASLPVGLTVTGRSAASSGDERAGRVEADAGDVLGLRARFRERRADGERRRAPDVVRRLLDEVLGRSKDLDRDARRCRRAAPRRRRAPRARCRCRRRCRG